MDDREFAGRTALVTGGSRGIGRAICLRLARAGAWVAINHSTSAEAAEETLALVKAEGGDGRIVCISSINGIAPSNIRPDRLIAYGTSKSAVIGFARNCATAFGPEIRVNCVAPGLIDTDMTKDMSDEMRARIIASTPARRIGNTEDVADLTYFLLSDAASFITGQTHVTSGGLVTLP